MLDIKLIRSNPEMVREALSRRGETAETALDRLLELDSQRRDLLQQAEEKRALRNTTSQEIARIKKSGAGGPEVQSAMQAMREVGGQIKELETQLKAVEAGLEEELLAVPNLPDPTAPAGGEENSREEMSWGTPRTFDLEPKDHLDLALPRDLIDMERGAKVSGSRFAYLKGDLVLLELALVRFEKQEYVEAKDLLDQVFALEPNHTIARILAARIDLEMKKYAEATDIQGGSQTAVPRTVEHCVTGSKVRSDSSSVSKNSARHGAAAAGGQTSSRPPRTAIRPGASTSALRS